MVTSATRRFALGFWLCCLLLPATLVREPSVAASAPQALAVSHRAFLPIVSGPSSAPPPTSFELIDAAVTAGTISSETGLLYKVYNTFADPRLPPRYHGDDSKLPDSHALDYALQRWDSLSSPTREALRPFLTPPVLSLIHI